MIFRYQSKQILLILSMALAVKQKKNPHKETVFCISSWSQPSVSRDETRRKIATLQGSERRERENSNQAESFQNQQTEASLFNNKKKSFFILTNLSFNNTDSKRISFSKHELTVTFSKKVGTVSNCFEIH